MAQPRKDGKTPEEYAASMREARQRAREEAKQVGVTKEYELANGTYVGNIGGEEGRVTVKGGKYRTSNPGEQAFIENVLARVGKVVSEAEPEPTPEAVEDTSAGKE